MRQHRRAQPSRRFMGDDDAPHGNAFVVGPVLLDPAHVAGHLAHHFVREIVGLKPRQRMPKDVRVFQYFGITTDEAQRTARLGKGVRREAESEESRCPQLGFDEQKSDTRPASLGNPA